MIEMDLHTYYLYVLVLSICGVAGLVMGLVGYFMARCRRDTDDLQRKHKEIVEGLKKAYSEEIDKLDERLERIERILKGE